jgi:hypothetical protein
MTTTRVVTDKVRFSYCNVCSARRNELNGKDEFSTQVLIPKTDTDTVNAIKAAAKAALQAKWGDKIPPRVRNPLRDGDTETKSDGSPLGAEYQGHWYMSVKSNQRPGIIDRQGHELLGAQDVGSGDYGRVSLNAYAYDAAGNRGVAFGLNNVQLLEKGESLGGTRTNAFDDFGVAKSSQPAQPAAAAAGAGMEDDDIPW